MCHVDDLVELGLEKNRSGPSLGVPLTASRISRFANLKTKESQLTREIHYCKKSTAKIIKVRKIAYLNGPKHPVKSDAPH
jgi:hypothetical protein